MSVNGYRRMRRSEIVRAHVEWAQPSVWMAIDDEIAFWTTNERRAHLVATDDCLGLMEVRIQHRLTALLVGNFDLPDDREDLFRDE